MKSLKILLSTLLVLSSFCTFASIEPTRLRCEHLVNPSTIDASNPRLSWLNEAKSGKRGEAQSAYQIQVASSKSKLEQGEADMWDSGKQISDASSLIPYTGKELISRDSCWWQVRVWNSSGRVSKWSEIANWSMGILDSDEWVASWIGAPWQGEEACVKSGGDNAPRTPAPLFRKDFNINEEVVSAKIYITGLGYFELYVNGSRVGDDVLVPNQTNYGKREGLDVTRVTIDDNFRGYNVKYLSYDLKELVQSGNNSLGCILGNGFYNSRLNKTMPYGSPRLIAQLHISYSDGTESIIKSDTSWMVKESAILADGIYHGEHYDARLEDKKWCSPESPMDLSWQNAINRKAPEGKLEAHMSNTDKVMERIAPQKIEKLENGNYRVDFGEEVSGWVRLNNIKGEAGEKITILPICESPNNGTNSYTLRGDGEPESYAARFTWYVFREVEIENWPGELSSENITAEVVYTDIESTGFFECSNPLFNKINKIWKRSLTDNLHGAIISDCPHRERFAYTGDGQVACVTVMHNYDAASLYTKWIHDMNLAQHQVTGYVPNGAPWEPGSGGGVAWGAAMNIMPWEFYLQYADKHLLSSNYYAMQEQLRYMQSWITEDGIMHSKILKDGEVGMWHNLGDWCPPPGIGFPRNELVHTFYLWRCADFTSQAAKALGHNLESEKYAKLASDVKAAFHNHFYNHDTKSYGNAGSNIFALVMGVPKSVEADVIQTVRNELSKNDGHLYTGIFATQFFFETLSRYGMIEEAYAAMNKRTAPSYGWWIEQGATTTWEQWDGRNSRNHPMFGGALVWFYRYLAGMNSDPNEPGYKHIIIKPQIPKDLTYAKYSKLTPYGQADVAWERDNDAFSIYVKVPVGSHATIYVPIGDDNLVTESGNKIKSKDKNIEVLGVEDGYRVIKVTSGEYRFASSFIL